MDSNISIRALCIGKPEKYEWTGNEERSAFGKQLVSEAFLTAEGFRGDGIGSPEFHGGPDRAVCLYPFEHYSLWKKEFQKGFPIPSFGENLCVSGMLEKDVWIGDTYRVGNARIQITQGRIPCSKISKFNQVDRLLKRVFETGFTGYLFRVLEEGSVRSDSKITLEDRKNNGISVLEANQIMFHDRGNYAAIEKLLEIKELAVVWQERLKKTLQEKV